MLVIVDTVFIAHFWSAVHLRFRLKRKHPNELRQILRDVDEMVFWGRWLFPDWWKEAVAVQHFSIFQIDEFPVHALADDKVFYRVRRVRRGFFVWLYAILLGAAISSLS
jgi:hypothetical protein